MYYPDFKEFERLGRGYVAVPVMTELLLDEATPVSAFRRLHQGGPAYLLESMEGGETWGRYSLLASGARVVLRARGAQITVVEGDVTRSFAADDPLEALRELLDAARPAPVPGVPRFAGGAVGYLGYDLVRRFERLPDRNPDPLDLPDVQLVIADTVVVFDNLTHTVQVIHNARLSDDRAADYSAAVTELERTVALLTAPAPSAVSPATAPVADAVGATPAAAPGGTSAAPGGASGAPAALGGFESATGRERFCAAVEAIRAEIEAGEAIQVVLSHRLSRAFGGEPFDTYRALRVINPSPYMFHLDFGELQVVGASPEVLVRVEGERVIVRPIAGTRPRGADATADQEFEAALRADEKECAEHLMLVDLGRNDLGRVSRCGTVRVDDFMVVERYSHVMHLVSEVHGELRSGLGCDDALRAAFPAGTVCGAPKVRAMELIDEHEPLRRGVYAGAVGYFDYLGNMDTCIAIRTLVFKDGQAHLQVGAGIVADSVPEREWDETLHKAGALLQAIRLADGGLRLRPGEGSGDGRATFRRPLGDG